MRYSDNLRTNIIAFAWTLLFLSPLLSADSEESDL